MHRKEKKTTQNKVEKLKAKKKYYVRIRTYKTVNGKKSLFFLVKGEER